MAASIDIPSSQPVVAPPSPPVAERGSWGVNGVAAFTLANKHSLIPEVFTVRPDGGVVACAYESMGSTVPYFFAFRPDGTPDTGFGQQGFLASSLPQAPGALLATVDAIYVGYGGNATSGVFVRKLRPDGSDDPSYGTAGVAAIPSMTYFRAFDVDADGKIVVGGIISVGSPGYYHWVLARLNTDGTLDGTFGAGGVVDVDFGVSRYLSAIRVLSSGKILAAGGNYSMGTGLDVIQFLSNGAVDSAGFAASTSGRYNNALGSYQLFPSHIHELSGGGLMILGNENFCNGCQTSGFALKLTAVGTADAAFGTGGAVRLTVGVGTRFADMSEEAGGKFRFYGSGNSAAFAYQVTSTGAADSAFGVSGVVNPITFGLNGFFPSGVEVVGNDVYYLGSVSRDAPSFNYLSVTKADHDFNPRAAFATTGTALAIAGVTSGRTEKSAPAAGGKSYVIGSSNGPSLSVGFLARLTKEGVLDSSFAGQGFVLAPLNLAGDWGLYDVAEVAGGRVLVVGQATTGDFTIARYNADGALDTSYASSGLASYSFAETSSSTLYKAVIAPDASVYGIFADTSAGTLTVAHLLPDGTRDAAFGTNGIGVMSLLSGDWWDVMFAVVQVDGKLALSGYYSDTNGDDYGFIARVGVNGTLDSSFASGGVTTIRTGETWSPWPQGLAIAPSGKIYGLFYTTAAPSHNDDAAYIVALNSDGTPDTTFGTNGALETGSEFSFDTNAWMRPALRIGADGNLVAFGFDAGQHEVIRKWDPTGAAVASFGANGVLSITSPLPSTYRNFTDFRETPDHDYLIMYDDTRMGIVRVGSDGAIH